MKHACIVLALAGATLALVGCGQNSGPVETVPPATGADLIDYSENITDGANRRRDAALYEYFCKNAIAAPCPADIDAQLEPFSTMQATSRLDLADAFTRMKAGLEKGDPGALISDEEYLRAAYLVALGREPDADGAAGNLEYIERTGERKTVLRSMLQSAEFRSK